MLKYFDKTAHNTWRGIRIPYYKAWGVEIKAKNSLR